ncbi:MAG: hypothetical protein ACXAC2_11500 [Candidatus Kariarchaeaceae archaeon]
MSEERIVDVLKLIETSLKGNDYHSPNETEQMKILAAKLYVSHTNREISLTDDAFQMIVDFLQESEK